jgi:hypothetical protein
MEIWECGNAVEQDREMCFSYYERFDLESRQKSKTATDYT